MAKLALKPLIKQHENLFAEICAWILNQSVMNCPQDYGEWKTLLSQENSSLYDEAAVNSDATWDMIVYWLMYLGLTNKTDSKDIKGFYPDPTEFLKNHLNVLFNENETLSVEDFISNLGELCPVLDGGAVFEKMNFSKRPDNVISDSLSFAIERLKFSKHLDYHCPNDQRDFHLLSSGDKIAYITIKKRL